MKASSPSHIALLDLYSTGHHRSWLEMLVRYHIDNARPGRLSLIVSRDFRDRHGDFLSTIESSPTQRISILEYDASVPLTGGNQSIRQLLAVSREHGAAARRAIDVLSPDHLLFMYFDHAQMALPSVAAAMSEKQVSFSGILFRPTTHLRTDGIRSRFTSLRKKLLLQRALKTESFCKLLCLDPDAVEHINAWSQLNNRVAVSIPDGLSMPASTIPRHEIRNAWNCNSETVVFLFFGMVSRRKGIDSLLRAAGLVNRSARKSMRIVIAGSVPDDDAEMVSERVGELDDDVPILLDDRFIPDGEMSSMFDACDVVLTPYVGHIGSSNVLIRAAAAGKPVIGPDEGLVGRLIRKHRLGISLDTNDPERLARAMELSRDDLYKSFDPVSSRQFASRNSPEQFAHEVFAAIEQC